MNKQLTKRNIGIAASAALMASLAVSGSAFAGKYDNNGDKGSISVLSVCTLDKVAKTVTVETIIMDTSSVYGDAELDSMGVQAVEKGAGKWSTTSPVGMLHEVDPPQFTTDPLFENCSTASCNVVTADLCAFQPVSTEARSVNAVIEVLIKGEHNNKEIRTLYDDYGNPYEVSVFEAKCSDDPETDEDEVALLNIGNQSAKGATSFCN